MRALILGLVLALNLPAHAQPTLGGAWHGIGLQAGPEGAQSTWDIVLTIRADIESRIDYPSLGCRAKLHELSRTQTEIEFREEITYGECIDGGIVTARLVADRVFWFWRLPKGGNIDASAVLYRNAAVG